MRKNKLLIFVHVPKAGGTTLGGIIHRQYGKYYCCNVTKKDIPQLIKLPSHKKDRFKALQGHRALNLHKYFKKEAAYITMLRNPIERVISYYYFYLLGVSGDHKKQEKLLSTKYSLKECVQNGIFPNEENRQVKILSGNLDIPHGSCTIGMLEEAKRNIDDQFDFVGIMEYFDESLIMLMLKFGWRYPFYWKRNVTFNRPLKIELDDETLRIIEEYNQLDIELYQYAKKKFENELKEMDINFHKKLAIFRKINPYFRVIGETMFFLASLYKRYVGKQK